jgi:hypothetical protein
MTLIMGTRGEVVGSVIAGLFLYPDDSKNETDTCLGSLCCVRNGVFWNVLLCLIIPTGLIFELHALHWKHEKNLWSLF